MNEIEILKEGDDRKDPIPEKPIGEDSLANFMYRWRSSDFYRFVMKIIEDELNTSYIKDIMTARIIANEPMDDHEVAQEMKTEVRTNLRLQKIKDVLQ